MKKYFAPEAEVFEYKLTSAILSEGASKEYGGDEIVDEETTDPFA